MLEALCSAEPRRCHVPAPCGRLGGYPVTVSRDAVTLDLAPDWVEADALEVNRRSLPYDGIEGIDDDGTVRFSGPCVDALQEILGRPVTSMSIDEAPDLARALVAAVD